MNVGQIVSHGMSAPVRFALELEDSHAGWLFSASGGNPEGGVVPEPPGKDGVIRKHIGGLRYADIELTVDTALSQPLSEWLAHVTGHDPVARDGAVRVIDLGGKDVETLHFFQALVREIRFPGLDATSKEPVRLAIKVAPESTRRIKGTGAQATAPPPEKRRGALASNFRLSIEGVDCKRVTGIEPITIKQRIVETQVGGRVELEPGALEIGELLVAVSGDATDFVTWLDDFVVNRKSANEKKGTLELLTPDMRTVLFTLTFRGLGIFKLKQEMIEAERVPKWRASMYCEEVGLAVTEPSIVSTA